MQRGFSLVELSIVLVILGLLVGGVLGGRSLIKAAELRAVGTEVDQWRTAVNTFRTKYNGIPGDLINAGQFWGFVNTSGANGNCSAPATDVGTGTETCSGDGNSRVDQDYEIFRFWQHLVNAGLVNGQFTGVAGSGGTLHAIPEENVPASRYAGGAWHARWIGLTGGIAGFYFANDYGHFFQVGASWPDHVPNSPLFTPEDAWNIDSKTDDGRPARGRVVANAGGPDCTTAGNDHTDLDGDYRLDLATVQCVLHFVKAF